MITPETTIKELLEHPIGHDVISKILMQMGVSNKWVDNPVVGKLKLKQLEKMLVKRLVLTFLKHFILFLTKKVIGQ